MSKNNTPPIEPVTVVFLGVILLAISIILITFQPNLESLNQNAGSDITSQLIIAFITGITTGGLSCLAMQGGLLASSLAHQVEQDYAENKKVKTRFNARLPIFLFLLAKLIAYTLLGALLGWLGSYFTFSPMTRAILMIAIAIFMIGNALRMFNVHPVFRYFSIEPPKFITRYIRKTAKGTDTATPLFLGALTVFIPCGVTQAMMATALGTGSVIIGAALMFAFTLGTSPVFFIIAYLTTQLGARLEKFFMRFVAIVILILGFVTLDGGLNLIGSSYLFKNLTRNFSLLQTESAPEIISSEQTASDNEITLYVQNQGYFPETLKAPAGKELKLNLVTDGVYSCALAFLIPDLDFYQMLPPVGTTQVDIPAQTAGTEMYFTCSMGMYTGQIVFE